LAVSFILFGVFFIREYKNVVSMKPNAWTEDARGDCAVVLTGGKGRVKDGFSLLARGEVRKLIISGVFEKAQLKDIYPELPFVSTVNPDDIVLEKHSQTTYGNALQTRTLVDALKCRDLILITSQTHMYRAYKTFRSHFSKEFKIQKRSLAAGSYEHDLSESLQETIKSLFYSVWAY
jgi:uncharacterized SAM-binding protein YcdF (DUF218 family)